MTYRVKKWNEFQHYKDRNPTWIKLHKSFLDDYDFQCLPVASRALAPMLWLLASEHHDHSSGVIDGDDRKISFRLRISLREFMEGIKPLMKKGFIESDSNSLAEPEQLAIPETYREETYREEDIEKKETDMAADFENLWVSWRPFEMEKGSKSKAKAAYITARKETTHETIIDGCGRYLEWCHAGRQRTQHIVTWLNQRRWADEYPSSSAARMSANGKSTYADSLQTAAKAAGRVLDEKENLRAKGTA
jgi:hypothetical protein